MSSGTTVKLGFKGELRRVHVENLETFSLHELRKCVASMFPRVSQPITIHYQDDEGDEITVKSDFEVTEAIDVMRRLNRTVRFEVSGGEGTAPGRDRAPSVHYETSLASLLGKLNEALDRWQPSSGAEDEEKSTLQRLLANHSVQVAFQQLLSEPKWWGLFQQINDSLALHGAIPRVKELLSSPVNSSLSWQLLGRFLSRCPEVLQLVPSIRSQLPTLAERIQEAIHEMETDVKNLESISASLPSPLSSTSPQQNDSKESTRETLSPMEEEPIAIPVEPISAPLPSATENLQQPLLPPQESVEQEEPALPGAEMLEDVSIPDGTVLPPNFKFRKIWKISNASAVAWPEGCSLVCSGGADMDQPKERICLESLAANSTGEIGVNLCTPSATGRYSSFWTLELPNGQTFGDKLWVDIVVDEALGEVRKQSAGAPVEEVTAAAAPATEEAIPAPVPASAPAAVDQWLPHLLELENMGFSQRERNIQLLEQHNGNLESVIDALLS